jgi:tetratricopeptide (TPR) repeat protein
MYQDDLEKDKDYYERALEIQKEQLGPNHVDVAVSYTALGHICYNNGDLEKARDCYGRTVEIGKEKFDPNHVNVACSFM